MRVVRDVSVTVFEVGKIAGKARETRPCARVGSNFTVGSFAHEKSFIFSCTRGVCNTNVVKQGSKAAFIHSLYDSTLNVLTSCTKLNGLVLNSKCWLPFYSRQRVFAIGVRMTTNISVLPTFCLPAPYHCIDDNSFDMFPTVGTFFQRMTISLVLRFSNNLLWQLSGDNSLPSGLHKALRYKCR